MSRHRRVRRTSAFAVSLATFAAATAAAAVVGLGSSGPATAASKATIGPCPNSAAIDSFKEADNVGAFFANVGSETTYTFVTISPEDQTTAGVPGLVKYCVYPEKPFSAPVIDVSASGENGATWTSALGTDNFGFLRPGGNKTNIALDQAGALTMGTADWGEADVPAEQAILLHINDAGVCSDLYGDDSPSTCFVKPSSGPVCNAGDTSPAYNAIPFGVVDCAPPSHAFEAQQTNEFGDGVTLAPGTGRTLESLRVDFQSYACETSGHWNTGDCVTANAGATFSQVITARIYDANNLVTPLATATQTFDIPFRPSADPSCADPAQWRSTVTGECHFSIGKVLTFDTWAGSLDLPDEVVWTVAFNTTHYGYVPETENQACFGTAAGCPYDSLNVGVTSYPGSPYAGADMAESEVFISRTPSPGWPTQTTAGPLQAETGWTGYRPLGAITTTT